MKDAQTGDYPKVCVAKPFCIHPSGPDFVLEKVAQLARTEDIRFSPDGKRLAIAGYAKQSIVIFDIQIKTGGKAPKVTMHDYIELNSEVFNYPHGLDFVDNETLVVANRKGAVTVFNLPASGLGNRQVQATPLATITKAEGLKKVHAPGSVAVSATTPEGYELLVCNNFKNRITRHRISGRTAHKITSNKIVLERELDVPDGVAMSASKQLFAISNHFKHQVWVYRNDGKFHRRTLPIGTLKGLDFPHGLRFFNNDHYLLVADAGLPYLWLYHSADANWEGEHSPICAVRVMSEGLFLKGHYYHQEGGPKGLDFSPDGQILATTCETQPLKFYHAPPLLAAATS
ncbi:MAG: hypothetical protein GQ535_02400 [Rhodobacteraceae bacterium]|nr:hypothetical protein [Paracoccaceae bacterium]